MNGKGIVETGRSARGMLLVEPTGAILSSAEVWEFDIVGISGMVSTVTEQFASESTGQSPAFSLVRP